MFEFDINGQEPIATQEEIDQAAAQLPEERPAVDVQRDLVAAASEIYCSLKADTRGTQRILYNALNKPAGTVAQMIGNVLEISDVIAEPVQVRSERTGDLVPATHVVLIDANGDGYTTVSVGIYNAIRKLISVYGAPTWNPPLPLKIVQQQIRGRDGGPRNVLTLEVVDI